MFYTLFSNDTSVASLENYYSSAGEEDSDIEVDDQLMLDNELPPLGINDELPPVSTSNISSAHSQNLSFVSSHSYLPESIWDKPWTPHRSSADTYSPSGLALRVFSQASLHTTESLVIEGHSIDDLVDELLKVVEKCAKDRDFTKLLAADRSFIM